MQTILLEPGLALESALVLKRVGVESEGLIDEILSRSPGYLCDTEGTSAVAGGARQALLALPPRCRYEQKYVFVVYFHDEPVALIDLIDGYPDARTVFIGLLLIVQSHQGQGLGQRIFALAEAFARHDLGCNRLRLAVIEGNSALEFWRKMGFSEALEPNRHQGQHSARPIQVLEKRY